MIEHMGYEVAPVFSRGEIAAARAGIGAYIDQMAKALLFPFEETFPELGIERRLDAVAEKEPSIAELLLQAVCTDAHRRPELRTLAESERLRHEMERIVGAPLAEPVVRLRANLPVLPHHRHPWHSDVAREDTPGACVRVAAWIPLGDVHAGNGTLEIAVGRRTAPLPHMNVEGKLSIPDGLVCPERRIIECKAGHCVFIDRFTPHRAVENKSKEARWSLVVWAKPENSL